MLPVMLGYIGGLEKPTKTKGFITSVSFVLGLAVTFAILGIVASLLGKAFGQIGPAWLYIIGFFSIIMGLQLIGVININLPGLKAMPEKKGGVLGSFGVGLLFGLVASPCATPVLAVLMTYVAGQGNIMVWRFVALYLWAWPRNTVDYCGYLYSRFKESSSLTKMGSLYYVSKRWPTNNIGFIFLRTYRLVIKAREQ